jgi:hypothetical protein
LLRNVVIIQLFPPKASNVEECKMSFWNVLLSVLYTAFVGLLYSLGFEIGYSAVMNGHNLVGVD